MSAIAERQSSPSPSRRLSVGKQISALGTKLSHTLSRSSQNGEETDYVPPMLQKGTSDRSVSRGREAFQSTGRGGIGNIRQASLSRDARPESGPDDFSQTRGREPLANPNQLFSTGRGGAGNMRSPSRDPSRPPALDATEKAVIKDYIASHEGDPHSTGRGGVGNINRSRSRDTPSRHVFSTGRGGAGNIVPGDGVIAESIDEDERRKVSTSNDHDGLHSTGRGGAANITHTTAPAVERTVHAAADYESHGRGGAGNIIRERSRSRGRT